MSHEQAPERLHARVVLVSGVRDQPLAEQEQPGELARLEDAALAVLARDIDADLERRPLAVLSLPESIRENELLPRIEMEPGHLGRARSPPRPPRRCTAERSRCSETVNRLAGSTVPRLL
jgi:hypothetical protein